MATISASTIVVSRLVSCNTKASLTGGSCIILIWSDWNVLLVNLTLRQRADQDNVRWADGLGAVDILYSHHSAGALAGAAPLIFVWHKYSHRVSSATCYAVCSCPLLHVMLYAPVLCYMLCCMLLSPAICYAVCSCPLLHGMLYAPVPCYMVCRMLLSPATCYAVFYMLLSPMSIWWHKVAHNKSLYTLISRSLYVDGIQFMFPLTESTRSFLLFKTCLC